MKKKIRDYLNRIDSQKSSQNAQTILNCYQNSLPIPHHLRKDAIHLLDQSIYSFTPTFSYDLLLTGAKTSMGRQFQKTLSLILGGSVYKNESLDNKCLLVIGETKGQVDRLTFSFNPYGPTFHFQIMNVRLKGRIRTYSKRPKVIFDNFENEIGKRVMGMLKTLFPKTESKRVVVFKNERDVVSFRHYFFDKEMQRDVLQFDMKLFKVFKGTYGNEEEEWTLRRFMNSRKYVI